MQLVSATKDADGNYVLVVKPLPQHRLSKTKENVHVAGTDGWSEPLGLTIKDPEGVERELRVTIDIRYMNPHHPKQQAKVRELTIEELKGGSNKNVNS